MKAINLMTHLTAYAHVDFACFSDYSIAEAQYRKKKVREDEEDVLSAFVSHLQKLTQEYKDYDGFFWNYTIPNISKEFDLLRIGENSVINIELKSTCPYRKALKQLQQNAYYLSFLGLQTSCFTYVQDTQTLYALEDNKLKEIGFEILLDVLRHQILQEDLDIEKVFVPSHYLISPFNQPQEFLDGQYFLTNHQSNIKKTIIEALENQTQKFFAITGDAGSGKTVITYDLAKSLSDDYKVIVIHCAALNEGQQYLNRHGMHIISVKEMIKTIKAETYDLIIVDETQRLWERQFHQLLKIVEKQKTLVVFSYDRSQTLSETEQNSPVITQIKELCTPMKLTKRIRTNPEIMSFVANLFDLNNKAYRPNYRHIDLVYFPQFDASVKDYIHYIKEKESWYFINYTSSFFNETNYDLLKEEENGNSHSVIGQEFDHVVVFIDDSFYYQDNRLSSFNQEGVSYLNVNMLYQNITRAKEKLKIIVINNPEVFKVCVHILKRCYL